MTKTKKYNKIIHVPVTDEMHDKLVKMARGNMRTLADMVRLVLSKELGDIPNTFKEQIIEK